MAEWTNRKAHLARHGVTVEQTEEGAVLCVPGGVAYGVTAFKAKLPISGYTMGPTMGKSITQILDEEAAAAEATKDDLDVEIPPHVKISRGGPRTRVLQVRLNDDELAALEAMAEKRNLPASTVVREMILNVLHPTPAQVAAKRRLVGEFENYLDRLRAALAVKAAPRRSPRKTTARRG